MKPLITLIATLTASVSLASDVEIVNVQASQSGDAWRFDVTLRHADSGWEVLAPDGSSLGMRVLAHPHVNEQPFTRSLGGVVIPEGVTEVVIRVRDNVDGWNAETYGLILP